MSVLSSLILLQVLSRLLHFGLQQAILRWCSLSMIGLGQLQLEFLQQTILNLSREPVRWASLRQGIRGSRVALLLGLLIAILLVPWWVRGQERDYSMACLTFAMAALLELAAEPHLIWLTVNWQVGRLWAEGLSLTLKGLITLTALRFVAWEERPLGLLAFSLGQLTYALSLHISTMLLSPVEKESDQFNGEFLQLVCSLLVPHVARFLLAQGDPLLMQWLGGLSEQGEWAIVSNYGGLLVRLLLQPMEEAALIRWSNSSKGLGDEREDKRGELKRDQASKTSRGRESDGRVKTPWRSDLAVMLRFYGVLGACFMSIAPWYCDLLLRLLLGRDLATKLTPALHLYCWLLPVMGVSGLLETLQHVRMDARLARWLPLINLLQTVAYVSTVYRLREYGATRSLILGNLVNFGSRALFGLGFALHQGLQLRLAIPRLRILGVCGVAALIARCQVNDVARFILGVLSAMAIGGSVYWFDPALLRQFINY